MQRLKSRLSGMAGRGILTLVMALLALGFSGGRAYADNWYGYYSGSVKEWVCDDWFCIRGHWEYDYRSLGRGEAGPPNFDWGGGGPGNGIPDDGFNATWTGDVTLPAGQYEFTTISDDGVRLYLDGNNIIDFWSDHAATERRAIATVEPRAGSYHQIRMEYYENDGAAVAKLGWRLLNSTPYWPSDHIYRTIREGESLGSIRATDPDGDREITYMCGLMVPGIFVTDDCYFQGAASYKSAGSYTATLTAMNSWGGKASTQLHLTVLNTDTTPALAVGAQSTPTAQPVNLQLAGSDVDGDTLRYSVTGLPPGLSLDPATGKVTGTIPYGSAGTYNVTAAVTDNTATPGNPAKDSASQSFVWTVTKGDTTPPVITATRTPAANAAGWNNTGVTVSFQCTDAESGIASCSEITTLSQQGSGQSVTGTATDQEGNTATLTVSNINIDMTPPTPTGTPTTQPNAFGWYRGDVMISWSPDDNLSGVNVRLPVTTAMWSEGANLSLSAGFTDRARQPGLWDGHRYQYRPSRPEDHRFCPQRLERHGCDGDAHPDRSPLGCEGHLL